MKHKSSNIILRLLFICVAFTSCSDEQKEVIAPNPEDITFEDQALGRFTFTVPDAPFKAGSASTGIITVNTKKGVDGNWSGFAVSNKNWRSYPWSLSPDFAPANITAAQRKAAMDSAIFSVYTLATNQTGNFLVGSVSGDDAFISLEKPAVVEHILVANTTYNFLLETFGSNYSGTLEDASQQYSLTGAKIKNNLILNTATEMFGRFNLPGTGGVNTIRLAGAEILAKKSAGNTAAIAARLAAKTSVQVAADSVTAYNALSKGYVKLTVKGFNGTVATGSVDYWLAIRPKVDLANPLLDIIRSNWNKVDLTSLGTVNKLVFYLSSSYTDGAGNMLLPPYFCLDGMRIR